METAHKTTVKWNREKEAHLLDSCDVQFESFSSVAEEGMLQEPPKPQVNEGKRW